MQPLNFHQAQFKNHWVEKLSPECPSWLSHKPFPGQSGASRQLPLTNIVQIYKLSLLMATSVVPTSIKLLREFNVRFLAQDVEHSRCTVSDHSHCCYSIWTLRQSISFALIQIQTLTNEVIPCSMCLDSCPRHLLCTQACWAWLWAGGLPILFPWAEWSFQAPALIWMGLNSRSFFHRTPSPHLLMCMHIKTSVPSPWSPWTYPKDCCNMTWEFTVLALRSLVFGHLGISFSSSKLSYIFKRYVFRLLYNISLSI